jgi:hypothetical protein
LSHKIRLRRGTNSCPKSCKLPANAEVKPSFNSKIGATAAVWILNDYLDDFDFFSKLLFMALENKEFTLKSNNLPTFITKLI